MLPLKPTLKVAFLSFWHFTISTRRLNFDEKFWDLKIQGVAGLAQQYA